MVRAFVLIVGMAIVIKWITGVAEARGRSQILWGLAAAGAYGLSFVPSGLLVWWLSGIEDDNVALMMLAVVMPFAIAALAVYGIGRLLRRLAIKVDVRHSWDVHCSENGPGRLEVTREAVRLQWQDRSQDVPRAELHTVQVDGECLRLGWGDRELLLMPLMRPQTRDGRIRQSQLLAQRLSPELPVAARIERRAKASA
jgi:hypothetical protein